MALGENTRRNLDDLGRLVLRVVPSYFLAAYHGWPKLDGFAAKRATFDDPLHVGSTASLVLAIVGELVGPVLVALGLGTRLFAFLPAFTMAVIVFAVDVGDPWKSSEKAVLFGTCFLAVMLVGGGRFSLDAVLARRKAGGGAGKPARSAKAR